MKRFHFTDPFTILPNLERQLIMLRCFESVLCLFYAEELKRRIIDMVTTTEYFRTKFEKNKISRIKKEQKNALKTALEVMVKDGAISDDERLEIKILVNFRNNIAHRLDQLYSDLEQSRFIATEFDTEIRKMRAIVEFDHKAVFRFDTAFGVVDRAARSHFNVETFHYGGRLFFSSSEKVLREKIKSIRKRLPNLINERERAVQRMKSDFPRASKILETHGNSQFNLRFPHGRMTRRGTEICYRLFDADVSELVIAQLFEMKLPSIRARHHAWLALGGKQRPPVNFENLPDTVVPSEYDE